MDGHVQLQLRRGGRWRQRAAPVGRGDAGRHRPTTPDTTRVDPWHSLGSARPRCRGEQALPGGSERSRAMGMSGRTPRSRSCCSVPGGRRKRTLPVLWSWGASCWWISAGCMLLPRPPPAARTAAAQREPWLAVAVCRQRRFCTRVVSCGRVPRPRWGDAPLRTAVDLMWFVCVDRRYEKWQEECASRTSWDMIDRPAQRCGRRRGAPSGLPSFTGFQSSEFCTDAPSTHHTHHHQIHPSSSNPLAPHDAGGTPAGQPGLPIAAAPPGAPGQSVHRLHLLEMLVQHQQLLLLPCLAPRHCAHARF